MERNSGTLDLLDSAGQTCILAGFVMMTLGLATGLIYAKSVWGRFWSWDPKEVWATVAWTIYGVFLHLRLFKKWRGFPLAVVNIVGFAIDDAALVERVRRDLDRGVGRAAVFTHLHHAVVRADIEQAFDFRRLADGN